MPAAIQSIIRLKVTMMISFQQKTWFALVATRAHRTLSSAMPAAIQSFIRLKVMMIILSRPSRKLALLLYFGGEYLPFGLMA
jgi:hypothetical protein